jgi:uncharacterized protein (TIGR02611 family)
MPPDAPGPAPEPISAPPTVGVVRYVRRVAVGVVGGGVLAVGVAMIVLPGPAILVIPAGLGILATEFDWARRVLDRVRAKMPWRSRQDGGRPT